jgi:hypothetical protein
MISPVCGSSAFKTGQPLPSAFSNVSSNFVPMILKELFSGSIGAKKGISVEYLFLSDVTRSRLTVVGEVKETVDLSLSIFLR